MRVAIGFLLFISFVSLLKAEELKNKSVAELYQRGFVLKATVNTDQGFSFLKGNSVTKIKGEGSKNDNSPHCFIHLKETAKQEIRLSNKEVIYLKSSKKLQKYYGRRGKYLHMEFLISDEHDLIGGLRVGQEHVDDFLWYDSTYKKSVNELNQICVGLSIEILPNVYVNTAGK